MSTSPGTDLTIEMLCCRTVSDNLIALNPWFDLEAKSCHVMAIGEHRPSGRFGGLRAVGKPPEIHLGWSVERSPSASASFLLFGEGNAPWIVRKLICKVNPEPERQPRVIVD